MTNPDPDHRIPPAWMRMSEAAWLGARAWRGFGHLGARGPNDGPPALVLPGFIANDRTTLELRRALARAGWRVHPWALGWSLGGVYAREVARAHPGKIAAVVTLGSPFSGDPKLNNVWRLYERVAGHKVDAPPVPRDPSKPPVPTLAIWSRADGIVAPISARGLPHESDKAVELKCSHMAFGVSRQVTERVATEIGKFVKAPL